MRAIISLVGTIMIKKVNPMIIFAAVWIVFWGGLYLQLHAAEVETTVNVVITEEISSAQVSAAVACNEFNCPERQPETQTWWERFVEWLF